MIIKINNLKENFKKEKEKVLKDFNKENIDQLRLKFIGKTGKLNLLLQKMKDLPKEERPQFGQLTNLIKKEIEQEITHLQKKLDEKKLSDDLNNSSIDSTLPSQKTNRGTIHPLNQIRQEIINFFSKLGFQIESGREIETEWYNFDALNVPQDHPARDMQDTFYIDEKIVLRTQTSNVQIHIMENNKPPIKVISPGFVYRSDSDASHAPMFQQVEGLVVNETASFADLKGLIYLWVKDMFGKNINLRFRPSFFPFTEPSAEMDISCSICKSKGCRVCKNTGWIEIGGCGCVDPNVFKKVGIDSEMYQGFAFGFGIDRIAMLKYDIPDINLLTSNDNRFLRQF